MISNEFIIDDQNVTVFHKFSKDNLIVSIGDESFEFQLKGNKIQDQFGNFYPFCKKGSMLSVGTKVFDIVPSFFRSDSLVNEGAAVSPMPGKVFKVLKSNEDTVEKGDTVLILEAMKMEHAIKASSSGVVKKFDFNEGDQVDGGVVLFEIES